VSDTIKLRLLAGSYCVLSIVGVLFLALIDPETAAYIPVCPCRLLTGLYCPGCGSLRAIHAITRLRFDRAFAYNSLFVVLSPLLLWYFANQFSDCIPGTGQDQVLSAARAWQGFAGSHPGIFCDQEYPRLSVYPSTTP
jgi:hypothetical protein